ncbi:MAG: lipid-A-disaccharide synthase [Gemmatimonadales bacterium]|nr:lipid-A-disaccharide synthase [Gemmatimonadales bacterium]
MTDRIFLSAGEPSGDLHGAAVVRALKARMPGVEIEAFGGPAMAAAGARIRWPMERYTVMGFAEIISKIPAHARLLGDLRRDLKAGRYRLVIPVDYPGFNLRVAEAAQAAQVPVLYYVAPQLWAWGAKRAARFRKAVDRFAVIFPFEAPFFAKLGLAAEYVGHPLADRAVVPTRADARAALGIPPDARVLSLFPGSRRQELARHWTAFRGAGAKLLAEGQVDRVLVATVAVGTYPDSGALELLDADPMLVLAAADAVLAKSGTTTLEAALTDTPMVVAYRVHPFTAWLARRIMRVQWISLPNLIANRPVVTELVQGEVKVDRLADAVRPLLDPDADATVTQRADLAAVREQLGGPGAAERVAELAATLLR